MKTKDKIVTLSRTLFNERGFESTTTSAIANACDILEGSLWYHFPAKKDILHAHVSAFGEQFDNEIKSTESADARQVIEGLISAYGVIWAYRYLFRDAFEKTIGSEPTIAVVISELNDRVDDWLRDTIIHASDNGIIECPEEDINDVAEIVLIIGRHWFDYSVKRYPEASNEYRQKRGIHLLIKALYSRLSAASKEVVDALYSD
ncbi:MAG: TetR/AcrR family transcriptional regulator [Pseudomonadota bacterium]